MGGCMDWQLAASISTVVQGIVVIVSVIFIWLQVRQQTKLAKIANAQSLVGLSSPFNMQLIQDRKMAELWINGAHEHGTYDDVDKYRYGNLLAWWLIFHENVYYQWINGLLDEYLYVAWNNDLKQFISNQHLELRWGQMNRYFQKEFRQHIDTLIEETLATTA
jgi:hypothetical protein